MNITEEGEKMPMGIAFDKAAEDMIKASKKKGKIAASKVKRPSKEAVAQATKVFKTIIEKKPKPNMTYQDLEGPQETWEEIFDALGSTSIDSFIDNLVTNYHPPIRK